MDGNGGDERSKGGDDPRTGAPAGRRDDGHPNPESHPRAGAPAGRRDDGAAGSRDTCSPAPAYGREGCGDLSGTIKTGEADETPRGPASPTRRGEEARGARSISLAGIRAESSATPQGMIGSTTQTLLGVSATDGSKYGSHGADKGGLINNIFCEKVFGG